MDALGKELAQEIQRVRQGRGLHAEHLNRRIGPRLRARAGIIPGEDDSVMRGKLTAFFRSGCAGLPDDLARVLLVSVGAEGVSGRVLRERLLALAANDGSGFRTVQRRMAEATERFARLAERKTPPSTEYYPDGWYLGSLSTFIRMDGRGVVVTQEREIVSDLDGLCEIVVSTTIAAGSASVAPPEFDVEFGGRLLRAEEPAAGYHRYLIRLPEPLPCGERHRVRTSLRFPSGHPFGSRYVFQSPRRCDALRVRLRFGSGLRPDAVTPIDGLPWGMIDGCAATEEPLDSLGEVELSFSGLRSGLAYGARWPAPRALG